MLFSRGYLSLNAVEASEPKNLPPAELSLSMIDFLHVIQLLQLLIWDFLFLRAVTGSLQELQPTRGDRGYDLNERAWMDIKCARKKTKMLCRAI